MPLVGIVIGSKSDLDDMKATTDILDSLGVSYELSVISAHRTPERAREYGLSAEGRGIEVILAAAGGSAALPGVMSSWSILPVIGIPLTSSDMNGVDSLYSIAQMPPGIPVACVSIGSWGTRNAAYLAASILSIKHPEIRSSYNDYRDKLASG
tara:strand:+ start:478 stop:936 length:459 start_codon:yes stop_codon:yes gene_type:complete